MLELGKGLICMGIYVFLKTPFDNNYLITEEFGNHSLIFKVYDNKNFIKKLIKKIIKNFYKILFFSLFISISLCLFKD
jgi:hypothetical protein